MSDSPRASGTYSTTSGGSPTKRRSPTKQTPKVKKEYPLVLLHITLLPPATLGLASEAVLKSVLPEKVFAQMQLLDEKLGDSFVRGRGVLIPHPRGELDVLEERLLESLGLVRPRIKNGHFVDDLVSQSESSDEDEDHEQHQYDQEGGKASCNTCGKKIKHALDAGEWQVKVYAANGLMGRGAWAAAWREMERVDVEVSVHLEHNMKKEIERRAREEAALAAEVAEAEEDERRRQEREREIYGGVVDGQDIIDGLVEEQLEDDLRETRLREEEASARAKFLEDQARMQREAAMRAKDADTEATMRARQTRPGKEVDLSTLLKNYLLLQMKDTRNAVIALLSVLVLWLAISTASRPSSLPPLAAASSIDVLPSSSFAAAPSLNAAEYLAHSSQASNPAASQVPLSSVQQDTATAQRQWTRSEVAEGEGDAARRHAHAAPAVAEVEERKREQPQTPPPAPASGSELESEAQGHASHSEPKVDVDTDIEDHIDRLDSM